MDYRSWSSSSRSNASTSLLSAAIWARSASVISICSMKGASTALEQSPLIERNTEQRGLYASSHWPDTDDADVIAPQERLCDWV